LQVFPTNFVVKVFYTKYFAKKLVAISCNFFSQQNLYEKNLKTKLIGNMSFFSSERQRHIHGLN